MFLLKNALQSARMNDYWMIKPFNVLKNALQGRINERMQIKPTKECMNEWMNEWLYHLKNTHLQGWMYEWMILPPKECSSVRMNVWMNNSTS